MEENRHKRRETMAKEKEEEEEPLSPVSRVLQLPGIDVCIVTIIGFITKINVNIILDVLKHNVHKHPRFSSKLGDNGRNWIKTKVNIEDHVVEPNIDLENSEDGDGLVDDYVSRLTMIPLDRSKPLWDIHILNVKTSDAEAVAVIRSHHSLGDGMSLMSLLLASTRKTSDPDAFPTIPALKRRGRTSVDLENKDWFIKFKFFICNICNALRLIWNTIVDLLLTLATMMFLKDTETPMKGRTGMDRGSNMRRFYRRSVSLDDIKLIKKSMNMTINDVLIGVTQAALSRYMNCRYGVVNAEGGTSKSDLNNLPDGIRVRACMSINVRPEIGIQPLADMMRKGSNCRWGNCVSSLLFPFSIGLEKNPLVYLSKAKSRMDRKKNSLHASILYRCTSLFLNMLGTKVGAFFLRRSCSTTTLWISNVVGPVEEVSFHGHPIAYIATSAYGQPQALFINFISYAEKMIFSIAVDPMVIPDPHKLLDEMEESLKIMKTSLPEGGLL